MQVHPIEPTLKTPGTERLKLENEQLLSNFAFNFNLRRFTEDDYDDEDDAAAAGAQPPAKKFKASPSQPRVGPGR